VSTRTWYIEDAGGGCQAFSEVLVLVSPEPLEVYSARIPLTWEENLTWEQMACKLVKEMLEKAGVSKEDNLLVCPGNIFNELHAWLTAEGFNWKYHRMEGLPHQVAEEAFYQQLLEAGFPSYIRPSDHNYRLFYAFVDKWIEQDPERKKYLKDRSRRLKPPEQHYTLRANGNRPAVCQECKEIIRPFEAVVEYRFKKNSHRCRVYFHPACSPLPPGKNRLETATINIKGQQITATLRSCASQELPCCCCRQPIRAGEKSLHWYENDRLYHCHLNCYSESCSNNRN